MSPVPVLVPRLRNLTLKTKLLLMMVSLLALSVSSLFLLHLYSERKLLSQLREYTEDLSTAIEVFQEQPTGEGDPQVVLQAYAQKLRQLGVKDVSIANTSDEVQASTNPKNVGKRLERGAKKKGPKEYVIRGVLGDESGPPGSQKTSTLSLPIVVGDTRYAMGWLAASFYDHPGRRLTLVGITGTNGKTTTTSLVASILRSNGCHTGMIGTLTYPSYEHNDASGRILALVTSSTARCRGIGRALIATAEKDFAQRGIRRVSLDTRLTREDAHKFYELLGYERNGWRFVKQLPASN